MRTFWEIVFSPITCITWIIIGGIAGSLAHRLVGSQRSSGFVTDVILGLIGAVVGGIVLSFVGFGRVEGSNINPLVCVGNIVVATFGASVLILVGRIISGNRPTTQ